MVERHQIVGVSDESTVRRHAQARGLLGQHRIQAARTGNQQEEREAPVAAPRQTPRAAGRSASRLRAVRRRQPAIAPAGTPKPTLAFDTASGSRRNARWSIPFRSTWTRSGRAPRPTNWFLYPCRHGKDTRKTRQYPFVRRIVDEALAPGLARPAMSRRQNRHARSAFQPPCQADRSCSRASARPGCAWREPRLRADSGSPCQMKCVRPVPYNRRQPEPPADRCERSRRAGLARSTRSRRHAACQRRRRQAGSSSRALRQCRARFGVRGLGRDPSVGPRLPPRM